MDIDIDLADRNAALQFIKHVPATRITNGEYKTHPVGVYVQDVPVHPMYDVCAIDYEEAEQLGYFKIDFLNLNIYKDVKSEEHLQQLIDTEPLWELLEHDDIAEQLIHVNKHTTLLKKFKPKSVEELAIILALIRPGKRQLISQPWDYIVKHVWTVNTDGEFTFKRAHAISYAMAIVVQLNLIVEQANGV